MRRLWAAGAALSLCLALGAPVTAQDASPSTDGSAQRAMVTGTERCHSIDRHTTRSAEVVQSYIVASACTVEASDPRVSGLGQGELWSSCFPDQGCVYSGTYELTGPGGTWTGTRSGVDDAAIGPASYLVILEGSGDYQGWTFVANWLKDSYEPTQPTFSGLIYDGPPPPWSESPLP